jgi:CBS domain-containing protein
MPRVKDEMIEEPVVATVPGTRRELMALFVKHGHAGFPVVKSASRKLVGVVTRQDIFDRPDESQTALLMDPNPPTTYPQAPVAEAAQVLVTRRLRVLPVISGANDLVGLVSARELLAGLAVPNGHLASLLRRRMVPVHADTPARVALEILRTTRATALPLLDAEARFAGVVTDGDFLAHARIAETTVGTTTGLAGEGDAWAWQGLRSARQVRRATSVLVLPEGPVASLGRRKAKALGINASLADAVALVLEKGVHHVPVVDEEGRLVDLLGEAELLEAVLPADAFAANRRP